MRVLLFATAGLFGIIYAAWIIWHQIPVYSAEWQIPNIEVKLTLRFYPTEDENKDRGRYLTIRTPNAEKTIALDASQWDWNSRTSIHLTPNQNIAVANPGPATDLLVHLDTLSTENARGPGLGIPGGQASDDWTYLGAFDFEFDFGRKTRKLRFVTAAEQPECIPSGGIIYDWQVRKLERQTHCDHLVVTEFGVKIQPH